MDKLKDNHEDKEFKPNSCKGCLNRSELIDGYCKDCRFNNSMGLFDRWNRFYNNFTRKPGTGTGNNEPPVSETIVKKIRKSENLFSKIKRFYRTIIEDDLPAESDHTEPSEVDVQEGSDVNAERESEDDLLECFSSLNVQLRNEELGKMHYVLKRYRDKETKLNEKLLKNKHEVREYDYFPKIGEKDHDLWDLKTRIFDDDTIDYMKVLFFRDSEYLKYNLKEIEHSLNKVRETDGILIDKFGIEINRSNISCLLDTNWLNDEIINFYLQILQEQNDLLRSDQKLPSCFFFSTFFFQALCGNDIPGVFYNYKSVARWTKRKNVNIFEKDLLIVPVHVSKVHWALGVVDMRRRWRRIMIFDSLGGRNPIWFKNIRRWLEDEHLDKMKEKLTHIDEWKVPKNYGSEPYTPSQQNSYDCGLFLCQFAKCISFAKGFNFINESSTYLRNMMIHEIITCKITV